MNENLTSYILSNLIFTKARIVAQEIAIRSLLELHNKEFLSQYEAVAEEVYQKIKQDEVGILAEFDETLSQHVKDSLSGLGLKFP